MRLIDADALGEYIENEFDGVCVYDVSGNEAAREFCDIVDIATTIAAIPVEWLRKVMMNDVNDSNSSNAAFQILELWQEEQEAR